MGQHGEDEHRPEHAVQVERVVAERGRPDRARPGDAGQQRPGDERERDQPRPPRPDPPPHPPQLPHEHAPEREPGDVVRDEHPRAAEQRQRAAQSQHGDEPGQAPIRAARRHLPIIKGQTLNNSNGGAEPKDC